MIWLFNIMDQKIQYYSLPKLGKIQQLKGNESLALFYYFNCLKLDVQNYLYLHSPTLLLLKFINKSVNVIQVFTMQNDHSIKL